MVVNPCYQLLTMPTGQAYDDIVSYFVGMGLNGNFNLNQWNVFLIDGPPIFVNLLSVSHYLHFCA